MPANQLIILERFWKNIHEMKWIEIKPVLTLNKPIYVGFIVLQLKK